MENNQAYVIEPVEYQPQKPQPKQRQIGTQRQDNRKVMFLIQMKCQTNTAERQSNTECSIRKKTDSIQFIPIE